jgi:sugar phosphate isomerase/epimerase
MVFLPDHIGIATDVYDHLPLAEALERLAVHTTLAEIYSGDRHDLLDAGNRRAALASGMRLTVHGPFEDLMPGSLHERERRHAVDEHRRHLEAAAEIGALCYAVHPDVSERVGPRDPRVVAALCRTIEDLGELQREYGVRVVLENMPGVGRSHFVAPGDLDLGELGFLLDTGHAAISGVLHDFLFAADLDLTHVHLHDNRGPADAHDPHLPLGRGVVDVHDVLDVARVRHATVILELLSEAAVDESLTFLQSRRLI